MFNVQLNFKIQNKYINNKNKIHIKDNNFLHFNKNNNLY